MGRSVLLAVLIVAGGVGTLIAYGRIRDGRNAENAAAFEAYVAQKAGPDAVNDLLQASQTLISPAQLEEKIKRLPERHQKAAGANARLLLARQYFSQGQQLFGRAAGLQEALTIPQAVTEDGRRPSPPPLHPAAKAALAEARQMYEAARLLADRTEELPGDDAFNFALNYTKGEIYFRATQVLAGSDTAKEFFDRTVSYFKAALKIRPGHTDTVINVELLIQNQNEMLAPAAADGRVPSMLRQGGSGRNKGF